MSALSTSGANPETAAAFWARLDPSLADGTCLGATFSKHRPGLVWCADKITFRPTLIKGSLAYQWAVRRENRETHENLSPEATGGRIRELLETTFERAHVFTTEADFAVRVGPDGGLTARQSRPTKTATPLEHNRSKAYLIPENVPCPFLAEIGVMTPAGKVRASKYAKFRQINRFLELIHDVIEHLPPTGELRIVDFGCGKSYLTFRFPPLADAASCGGSSTSRASTATATRSARCAGLSKKLDLPAVSNSASATSPARRSTARSTWPFRCTLATRPPTTHLAQAVAWQATVILSVPCCQHELARQIKSPNLAPLLQHGILHEQFASLATDALARKLSKRAATRRKSSSSSIWNTRPRIS